MTTQLVWFKRDLRVTDHMPLRRASQLGPVLCLYVYEDDLLAGEDAHACHVTFVNESLAVLREELKQHGGRLVIRRGRMPDVLDELHEETRFGTIWAHEETGNGLSYARDRRVRAWAKRKGVIFHEFFQNGVVRPLKRRDGWSRHWNERMTAPLAKPPRPIEAVDAPGCGILAPAELGVAGEPRIGAQPGGSHEAQSLLRSFLYERGRHYRKEMSSPVTAWDSCSRLSPHLAYGTISMRAIATALRERQAELRDMAKPPTGWLASLKSYEGRLHWHCHFMQKLEDEPRLEFENMARSYDGMREEEFDPARFDAWCAGQTGFPMVDACMRALEETGWINFRMRAMLMSFASYHLWLHWRPTALHLARLFVDYEPGVHYSQAQMQSGVTGINATRMYSPAKQVLDQDPEGRFLRTWLPELAGVPTEHLAEPHRMTRSEQEAADCRIGVDYPAPIVDHKAAVGQARRRISAIRSTESARAEAEQIFLRHGSRKRTARASSPKAAKTRTRSKRE